MRKTKHVMTRYGKRENTDGLLHEKNTIHTILYTQKNNKLRKRKTNDETILEKNTIQVMTR
jgi:hypothetical protein